VGLLILSSHFTPHGSHTQFSLLLVFSQNDDPFPSHIVNVFSFCPFAIFFTYSAIKYIFLSIYTLHFSKSYFSERMLQGVVEE
jgi:hypothetical protein